jgi:hypothetical protein
MHKVYRDVCRDWLCVWSHFTTESIVAIVECFIMFRVKIAFTVSNFEYRSVACLTEL